MEYGYSILMLIFAGAILLYAGLMALTKDYRLLPMRAQVSVKPKKPKLYMARLAKAVALAALSPLLSALVGFWYMPAAFVVFVVVLILALWGATRIMRGVE